MGSVLEDDLDQGKETLLYDPAPAEAVPSEEINVVDTVLNIGSNVIIVSDATASEGNELVFTVSWLEPGQETATVFYTTEDGSATAGEDYVLHSGTLNLVRNEIETQTITIAGLQDLTDEPDETFFLVLSIDSEPGDDLSVSALPATGTILDDVGPALSAADLFCLPSHSEGMPNALLEAMAAGRPICATAVGGVPEAIADGRSGLLVRPADPGALAGGLIRLMDDPTFARRLAVGAKQTAERRFSALRVARRYQNLYEQLISLEGMRRGCLATAGC